jgi:hypothetical protein
MLNSTGNTLNLGGGLPWSGTVTGAAGGYSGGSTPAYNPNTGNIIFGYTKSTVSQMVAINQALETAGTGIQLSGYKYSWNINNDLNNSGGNRGIVYGNVSLKGPNGNVLESFDYDYSTRNLPGFTTFSGTQLFENRYSLSAVDNLTVSFTGKDQNFWAGYYGPRVHVNDLSLLYTTKPVPVVVDPCISDPLSSPACPGYALATVKNSILGSTVSNASATSFVPAMNYTQPAPAAAPPAVADAAPALAQASPQQQSQQPAPQTAPQPQQQPGQDPNQNPVAGQDNPAQPSPQQAGPAPTSPQPAGGPPQTAQSAPPPSAGPSQAGPQQAGPATSGGGPSKLAMSVVKSAQAKEQAMQQMAVQNAAKAFEGTQQSSQAASNAAISMNQDMSANSVTAAAQFSSQSTQTSMQTSVQSIQGSQQTVQSTTQQQQANKGVQQLQQTTSNGQQDTQQQYTGTGLTVSKSTFSSYSPFNSINSNSMPVAPVQTAPMYQPKIETRQLEVETPQMQVASFGGMGKAGSPLSDMMQQRFEMMQENVQQQQTSTVNRNVQPNELAGGTDVAAMAQIPRGYEAYSIVTLRDAPFYKPETIYKNQTTVDNARVFRGLTGGSDAKHQEMVNQQYKLGE